ncbi:MAG: FAD-binding oxidoreductase [Anaerolineaceae bacterium]|nr:MAG: FAD-binding oxidoreductase [Anaerolineaceae bacterium]
MIEENTTSEIVNSKVSSPLRPLAAERLEAVSAWGGASSSVSYVYRPTTVEQLQEMLSVAAKSGRSVGLRGGGNSYGDAATNSENVLLDMRRMNRILAWDPLSGVVCVEPGVTISQLWQYVLEDGWWPPVVTGTSMTTIGGCAGMNVHGKNAYQVGPIGDHIQEFEMMLPSGEIVICNREENSDLFYAAIGGFGVLGVFTSITMQMKRVYSGLLDVYTQAQPNLAGMFEYFETFMDSSDYIVGWIDSFGKGAGLGQGDVHRANYLSPGADLAPSQTMRLDYQHLSPNMFGFMPRSVIWIFMRPFMNNLGTALINKAKYLSGHLAGPKQVRQSHAAFHFLLDYVPDWKNSYGPGGLIQYQPFIPKETARDAFADMLRLCQRRGLPNYLTVFKRHRPDDFLMTHGLDGYSLAMDFRITERRRPRVAALTRELDEIVLAAGGRFYFAKDSTVRPEVAQAYLGEGTIEKFRQLKRRTDPHNLLQTDLWRRVFG